MDARLQFDNHAGKTFIKLLSAQAAAAKRGINDIHVLKGPAFQHNEVIELPMNNGRYRHKTHIVARQRNRAHTQTILASSFDDGQRGESIATNTTAVTYLGDRRRASVIAEDHRQAGSATLGRTHLDQLRNSFAAQVEALLRRALPASRSLSV